MNPPSHPCPVCGQTDWKPIKQMSETLGYRCAKCGKSVVWASEFMGGRR